ncbi:ethanolamine utilization protein EutN [Rhodococcus sp. WS1]|uniref:EutN/CcmL family microcompartment protein n=1 Tax=unclassified Rhodococcus (in: high G+C Gram-positive bacteria) TaxID=192944 RepID=UPI0011417EB7|nr:MULTISPECIES: EutN/CcmL family microcompartment protein [unclassified Rhodococcus (in: high G+C Gram-positive bacteria)]ROZ52791.1 ethanolamine utilization protein EutN [Rhodococcus sp. WS1]TQC34316.1 ethanolamine utilization protein EutN [Rhodococcus sp. WS7]
MKLARVVGQVVATAKAPQLSGMTILLVEDFTDNSATGQYAAVDLIGAGQDEIVLVATGSGARIAAGAETVPTDAAIVAIADTIITHGSVSYSK